MLKTRRTPLLVVALLLCIVGGSLTAYAAFWVTSDPVHVSVNYAVVLSSSVVDSSVTLNAAVTNNNNPVEAGIGVDFYYSLNGGPWTYFATYQTGNNGVAGVAQAIYTATANGGYDFEAIVSIP
jgi:hypothetical protein